MDDEALSAYDEVQPAPPEPSPLRRPGRRYTDEEIFAALRAAEEDGLSAAELCAAHDITLPLYCVWKRKYGALSLDELRALRRQEAKRRRTLTGLALGGAAAAAIGLGTLLLPDAGMDTPAAEAAQTVRRESPAPPSPTAPAPVDAAAVSAARDEVAAAALAGAYDLPSADEGFAVQIAAKPDLGEARALVEQLVAAGHPAYLLSAEVGNEQLFRVRVGPFSTRQAAGAAVRRLEREGYDGAWMVR